MTSRCPACKANLPFLRSLAKRIGPRNKTIELVLLFPKEGQDLNAFLSENGLVGVHIERVSFRDIGLVQIPVFAIREKTGAVSASWVGVLDERTQEAILKNISAD